RYNGPLSYDDQAYAMTIDDSGNVYVTGRSFGSGTTWDYATIKYDSSGHQLWVSRYNGPADSTDCTDAIAIDSHGNVYVTGLSQGRGTDNDYATIKYDPNGNELWVQRYNGPKDLLDCPEALALDASGNIYVTGISFDSVANGMLYKTDYATIKYNASGSQVWVKRYNGPANGINYAHAIAVDALDNVYVTGDSDDMSTWVDYATIKYDSSGNQVWVRRYTGLGGIAMDVACAIAVDAFNNVYVTGYSRQNTSAPYNSDYATIKYDSSGNQLWVKRYNGILDIDDEARAIAVDDSGNVYVTGVTEYSRGSGTSDDYATLGYDADGVELWLFKYDGPANSSDEAYAIAVDESGNVYVTGYSFGIGSNKDYATIKYFQALRGDTDGDGVIDVLDIIYLITYLYKNGSAPQSSEVGNVNCDEVVDIGDVVYLINYIYKKGSPPDC
ncbi:MAG: SBBP repeat-containing protein, partial [Candidatus Zixiibacteriota bacterium]